MSATTASVLRPAVSTTESDILKLLDANKSPFGGGAATIMRSTNMLPFWIGVPVLMVLLWIIFFCTLSTATHSRIAHGNDFFGLATRFAKSSADPQFGFASKFADARKFAASQVNADYPNLSENDPKRYEKLVNAKIRVKFQGDQLKEAKRFANRSQAYGHRAASGLLFFIVLLAVAYTILLGFTYPPPGSPRYIDVGSIAVANIFYLVSLVVTVILLFALIAVFANIRCFESECDGEISANRGLRLAGVAIGILAALAAVGVSAAGLALNVMEYQGYPVAKSDLTYRGAAIVA